MKQFLSAIFCAAIFGGIAYPLAGRVVAGIVFVAIFVLAFFWLCMMEMSKISGERDLECYLRSKENRR